MHTCMLKHTRTHACTGVHTYTQTQLRNKKGKDVLSATGKSCQSNDFLEQREPDEHSSGTELKQQANC